MDLKMTSKVVKEKWLAVWSVIRRPVRVLATMLAGVVITLLVVAVLFLNNRPDLRVWHTAELDEEFTTDSPVTSFEEYLVLWTRDTSSKLEVRGRRYGRDAAGVWGFRGTDFELSGGTGKEAFGTPIWLPKLGAGDGPEAYDLYLRVWVGGTTKSSNDYVSTDLLLGRWK